MAFLEAVLAAAAGRPVAMFTHAPPLGSGLKVLQVWCPHHRTSCAVSPLTPPQPLHLIEAEPEEPRKINEEQIFCWWQPETSSWATAGCACGCRRFT